MPRLELPVGEPGRIFQLRTYESPSEKTGLKKIEMFDTAEIAIFRKTGLNPVWQTLVDQDAQPDLHARFQGHGREQGRLEDIHRRSRSGRSCRQCPSMRTKLFSARAGSPTLYPQAGELFADLTQVAAGF